MYKEMCGVCGNEADVQLGKIELPHPLYAVFVCGDCSQDIKEFGTTRLLVDEETK